MRTIHTPALLLAAALLLQGCAKLGLCKDVELTVPHTDFTGTQLRTDGYYYGEQTSKVDGSTYYDLLILYRNGIIMNPGIVSDMAKLDQYVRAVERSTRQSPANYRTTRAEWGLFALDQADIQVEYWQPGDCGAYTVKKTGSVLNDTTFLIHHLKEHYPGDRGVEESDVSQRFLFRHFTPKPDSTNDYL